MEFAAGTGRPLPPTWNSRSYKKPSRSPTVGPLFPTPVRQQVRPEVPPFNGRQWNGMNGGPPSNGFSQAVAETHKFRDGPTSFSK